MGSGGARLSVGQPSVDIRLGAAFAFALYGRRPILKDLRRELPRQFFQPLALAPPARCASSRCGWSA